MPKQIRTRWRCAVLIWVAAYPLMTTLLILLEPIVGEWPVPFRTLLLTTLMVPTMVFWLIPAVSTRIGDFLTAEPGSLCSSMQRPNER